jgi:hypothetical protein
MNMMSIANDLSLTGNQRNNGAFGRYKINKEQQEQSDDCSTAISVWIKAMNNLYLRPWLQSGGDGWARFGGGTEEGQQVSGIDHNTGKPMNFALCLTESGATEGGTGAAARIAREQIRRVELIYGVNWHATVNSVISDTCTAALATSKTMMQDVTPPSYYGITVNMNAALRRMDGNPIFTNKKSRVPKLVEAESNIDPNLIMSIVDGKKFKYGEDVNDFPIVDPNMERVAYNIHTGEAVELEEKEEIPAGYQTLTAGDEVMRVFRKYSSSPNDISCDLVNVFDEALADIRENGHSSEFMGGVGHNSPKNKLDERLSTICSDYILEEDGDGDTNKAASILISFIMKNSPPEVEGSKCGMHLLALMVAYGLGRTIKAGEVVSNLKTPAFLKEMDSMVAAVATGKRADELKEFQESSETYQTIGAIKRGDTRILGAVDQLKRLLVINPSLKQFPDHMKAKEAALKKGATKRKRASEFVAVDGDKKEDKLDKIQCGAAWWRSAAEVAYLVNLFSHATKISQLESEPCMGHFLLSLLETLKELHGIVATINGTDGANSSLEVNVFDTSKTPSSARYHECATIPVLVASFSDVAKEAATRLLKAFEYWFNFTIGADGKVTGIPLSMLLPALLDPRSRTPVRSYLSDQKQKDCENLLALDLIETCTWRRYNREKESTPAASPSSDCESVTSSGSESDASIIAGSTPVANDSNATTPASNNTRRSITFSPAQQEEQTNVQLLYSNNEFWNNIADGEKRTTKPPPVPISFEDVQLGKKAYSFLFDNTKNREEAHGKQGPYKMFQKELHLFSKKGDTYSREEVKRLQVKDPAYCYKFAFEETDIVPFFVKLGQNDSPSEQDLVIKAVLLINLAIKPANAFIERFFSRVSGLYNSRNCSTKESKIEDQSLLLANLDFANSVFEGTSEEYKLALALMDKVNQEAAQRQQQMELERNARDMMCSDEEEEDEESEE